MRTLIITHDLQPSSARRHLNHRYKSDKSHGMTYHVNRHDTRNFKLVSAGTVSHSQTAFFRFYFSPTQIKRKKAIWLRGLRIV